MTEPEIYPRRLVFMQLGCMFCETPEGETYMTHVSIEARLGYMSCSNCREKMKAAVEFWRKNKAYCKANHLKDNMDLKVKRSNGLIEGGWRLNNPLVSFADDGRTTIHCYNEKQDIGKWCYMDDVLEWNSV
jgi:hypothetical protein